MDGIHTDNAGKIFDSSYSFFGGKNSRGLKFGIYDPNMHLYSRGQASYEQPDVFKFVGGSVENVEKAIADYLKSYNKTTDKTEKLGRPGDTELPLIQIIPDENMTVKCINDVKKHSDDAETVIASVITETFFNKGLSVLVKLKKNAASVTPATTEAEIKTSDEAKIKIITEKDMNEENKTETLGFAVDTNLPVKSDTSREGVGDDQKVSTTEKFSNENYQFSKMLNTTLLV